MLLVQHSNEKRRATGTAPLLWHADVLDHLSVEVIEWSGRADNERLQARLQGLGAGAALLWTDGPQAASHELRGGGAKGLSTFVLLDGTWQEARRLYRKGPCLLRTMPRVALQPARASTYTLRGNHGWRRRFGAAAAAVGRAATIASDGVGGGDGDADADGDGADGDGAGLLCTAEAAAAALRLRRWHGGGHATRTARAVPIRVPRHATPSITIELARGPQAGCSTSPGDDPDRVEHTV